MAHFIRIVLPAIFVLLVGVIAFAERGVLWGEEEFASYIYKEVERAPKWPPNKKIRKRAPEIARITTHIAKKYHIDSRVSAVIMQTESSFRESIEGMKDKSDFGIMQVNRRVWGKLIRDLDMSTTAGQIEAGHRVLHIGYYDRCDGSHKEAVTFYSTGQCKIGKKHQKYHNISRRMRLLRRIGVSDRSLSKSARDPS